MLSTSLLVTVLAAFAQQAAAVSVSGSAEGFAAGVTGGGDSTAVYPTTTDELVSYLGDSEARVIVLSQTFDFRNTEGTTTATGCAPWGTASACQLAINQNNWCTNYQSDAASVTVKYDNAGIEGITVASDKTILGNGDKGVILGKGLRLANGVSNVIIQNIKIAELNPQYVWGGDAITLAGTDMVWIDHVTTYHIGRQHIVLGESASGRVTISNCDIDGESDYSATCDGYHYWNMYFTGSADYVTLKNNYIHHFSGRAPKVAGNTLLHAVNNYWSESSGHAFEADDGAHILVEGNYFSDVSTVLESGSAGELFPVDSSSSASTCATYLSRTCQVSRYSSSGSFDISDTDFLSSFKSSGYTIADADAASTVTSLVGSVGYGTI